MRFFVFGFLGILAVAGAWFGAAFMSGFKVETGTQTAAVIQATDIVVHEPKSTPKNPTLLFVGDIMLGRYVETLMNRFGIAYPFAQVAPYIHQADLSIGNFEGTVSETHVQAKPMTFQFSVRPEYVAHLAAIGFDVLSLANNHSNDYGEAAHTYTKLVCNEVDVQCIGRYHTPDETALSFHDVRGVKVGILALHTTAEMPSDAILQPLLTKLTEESDVTVVYTHWGEEYRLTHTEAQKLFAQKLIDGGADVVIGHHPHVVEDVELYKGKPIYYSLGNFIFDQYFSGHVQDELAVHMEITEDTVVYTLVPFTSRGMKSQPAPMKPEDARVLFDRILSPIAHESNVSTTSGTITVARD